MIKPHVIREVRRALQYGHPWLSPKAVMAYTRLPVDFKEVQSALAVLVEQGVAVVNYKSTGLGEVALATAQKRLTVPPLGKYDVLKVLFDAGEPMQIGAIATRVNDADWRVRNVLMPMVDEGRVQRWDLPGRRAKRYSITHDGRLYLFRREAERQAAEDRKRGVTP